MAILHAGANVVWADVDPRNGNVDPDSVAARITPRTRAIVAVHYGGIPASLERLRAVADGAGVPLVEDAAHAAESSYRGRKVGSFADATCFSLYATKNIAAGEGGLISTNRSDVAEAVQDLRLMRRGGASLYDVVVPGYKANLPDVLAAIALVQLDKVERHRTIRQRQFALYDEAVAALEGIERLERDPRDLHALHLYAIRIGPEAGASRDEYMAALREHGISTSIHFLPVHELSWYRGRFRADCPVAERAGRELLSLPLSPAHSDDDVAYVAETLTALHDRFTS
jgi:dTDP-4-amino-4,6-dideoxygalactose transaminase